MHDADASPATTTHLAHPPTVASMWDAYRASVVPRDAPAAQVLECRRAFYGGASAMLSGLLDAMEREGEPTARDIDVMTGLVIELRRFAAGATAGRN